MNRRCVISQDRLQHLLTYDKVTGEFKWKNPTSNRVKVGSIAGSVTKGYRSVGLDGVQYLLHRLAYLYITGEWPDTIDHINGNGLDNSWSNLRNCSHAANHQNKKVKGYYWAEYAGKFRVQLKVLGKHVVSSYANSEEEAARMYKEAKKKYHPFSERMNLG